jgi:RHS repeat-associated protein
MLITLKNRMRGVSLTETLIMMPVFLMLTLGALQYALIYEAKSSLDYATFMSARAGAVDHARKKSITVGLAKSLAPLYSPDVGKPESLLAAIAKAGLDVGLYSQIKILNPTKEAFKDFGVKNTEKNVTEIPNEMLHLASTKPGNKSKLNIQDANLLKVQVLYGYKLKVPFVNSVISTVSSWFTRDPVKLAYLSQKRLPVLATATVRMQSRAWDNSWVTKRADVANAVTEAGKPAEPLVLASLQRPWASGPTGQGNPSDDANTTQPGQNADTGAGNGESLCEKSNTCNNQPSINDTLCKLSGRCNETGNGSAPDNSCSKPITGSTATTQSSAVQSSQSGNPIHVVTGNKYQDEIDIRPMPGLLGLEFARHYNSQTSYQQSLGYGWSHTYDVRLERSDRETIEIRQADGRLILFSKGKQKTFTPHQYGDGNVIKLDNGGYDWRWNNGRLLQFNPDGQLHAIVARNGHRLQLHYIGKQLYKITDPQQRSMVLKHDKYGRIITLRDPAHRTYQYTYDEHGNLLVMQRPDKSTRLYHYEDPHDPNNLTGITDERNIRYATWAYDDQDRAVLGKYAGNVDKVMLEFGDNQTLVTNSDGETSTYHTETRNGIPIVNRIDGPGCSTCGRGDIEYSYDEDFRLTEVNTKEGTRTVYTYDEQGRKQTITKHYADDSKQLIARYHYQGDSHQPNRISRPSLNPDGMHTVDIQYSDVGQPEIISERGYRPTTKNGFAPIERTTRLKYKDAQLIAIDGPRDDVEDIIRLGYDDEQRLKTLTGADGRIQTVQAYDHYGRPTRVQNGTQTPVELSYNNRGDITRISQGTRQVRYQYDATGNLTQLIGPDGDSLSLDYDKAGRATALNSPDGRRVQTELDNEGRLTQRRLFTAQGDIISTVSYLYDAQGRLQSQQQDGIIQREYGYDDHNRLTRISNTQGDSSELRYNTVGQLLSLTQPGTGATRFAYDSKKQLRGITDARDNTTQYIKDDFGRVVKQSSPDTGTSTYRYDTAGNRIHKIDAAKHSTRYAYDAANRIIEQRDSDGTTKLAYDPDSGRLKMIQGPNTTESFAYNREGQLIAHTRVIDGKSFTTGYDYNQDGKLSEKHLPDEQVLVYHYYEDGDNNGDLRAITRKGLFGLTQTTLVGEIDQQAADGTTGMTYGNGLRTEIQYDTKGRPNSIATERTMELVYQYDEYGQITGIDENGQHNRYDYDPQGRLLNADTALGLYRYRYDAVGNRTQKQHASKPGDIITEHYSYANQGEGNRLTAIRTDKVDNAEQQYTYNVAGSPTSTGELRYEYNTRQRPIKVYRDNTLIAEYAYNRFGERIRKVVYTNSKKPTVTYYLYDGHTLTAEANASGSISAQYLYLNNHQPVIKLQGRAIYAIHGDHLGTPRIVTDEDQQTVWKADYSPFGKARITTAQVTLNLRFAGQYEDAETGTYYNYLRDYNPDTGRYTTSDPIGLKGGLNTYAYVKGNPIHNLDPMGLDAISALTGSALNTGAGVSVNLTGGSVSTAVPNPVNCPKPVRPIGYLPSKVPDWLRNKPAANDPKNEPGGLRNLLRFGRGFTIVGITSLLTGDTPQSHRVRWEDGIYSYLFNANTQRLSVYEKPTWYPTLRTALATFEVIVDQGNTWFRDVSTGNIIAGVDPRNGDVHSREAMERALKQAYEDYKANGGDLSYEDWLSEGMPAAYDKPIYNSQQIVPGTEINGVPVKDIRYGTNGKIAVIGQGMIDREGLGRGVLDIAEELRSHYDVEAFEPSTTANEEWRDMLDEIKEERGPDARFTDVELEQLQTYAENEAWAQKLVDEGYTVIDIGNPQGNSSSVFYDMEGRIIFDR